MSTKAEMTREILRTDLGKKSDAQILEAVVKRTGLSKSLATVYIKNNKGKLKEAEKPSKKASAKAVSKKAVTKKRPTKKKAAKVNGKST